MNSKKTFNMVMTALFIAIIVVMTFVPNVGYINLIIIKATLLHVPVIVGSIVLGPKNGAVLGGVFGLTSLIKNTLEPSLLSFAFSPFYSLGDVGGNFFSVIIAMVPRILVGVIPYFVYKGLMQVMKNFKDRRLVAIPVASAVGSLTNTVLVMNMIYLFFKEELAAAKQVEIEGVYDVILGIIAANGIPETIVAVVLGTAVSMALLKLMPQDNRKFKKKEA